MKKYIFIVLLLILGACTRFSEDVARQLILVDMLAEHRPDSALQVLRNITSPEELDAEQYARYCLSYVAVSDRLRNAMSSDSLINEAVKFFGRNPERYPKEAVQARYYLARIYQQIGREEEAMAIYVELEPRIEALKDYNLLGLLNSRMARLFRRQNHIDQSIRCYRKSVEYFKLSNNRRNEGYALSAVGYDYLYLKQYDSAVVYCQKAKLIAQQIRDTAMLSEALINMGIAYDFQGNSEAVKMYLLEAVNYEKRKRKLMQAYNYLSGAFFKAGQYEEARFYANYAMEMSRQFSDLDGAYGLCNSTWYLYSVERAEGRLRAALDYYYQYSAAKDSIAVLQNRNDVLAVQEKYKAEELEAENMRLQADYESERFTQMLGIFVVSLVFLFLLLVRVWHQRKILKQKELILIKESRIKSFLLKRLDVSKEIVAMAQYPSSDSEKLQQKLKLLVESLSFKLSDQKELIGTVNELFNDFAHKLTERFPQMTADELQLCCMIRCGFDAGLMATAMGVQLDTIYKKRSRLRKKILLDHDEDFELFLQEF